MNVNRVGCPLDLQEWAKANTHWSCFCMICLDQIERTGSLDYTDLENLKHLRMLSQAAGTAL